MRWLVLLACALLFAASSPARAEPFAALREAYAARDPAAAAAAYASDAQLRYARDGAPDEVYQGTAPIAASFKALFDRFDPREKLDLNFRETARVGNRTQGIYRLRVGRVRVGYGRYDVVIGPAGTFISDRSSPASVADFEEAAGATLFTADDDVLDRGYYQQLAGRYRLPDGCLLIVTRSVVRLFVRNSCTASWRGLSRVSGRVWTSGAHVLSAEVWARYRFAPFTNGASPALTIEEAGATRTAIRIAGYRTQEVSFRSGDGTLLAGTLYTPRAGKHPRPASVMLHGSGPQDRDGYASIIAVLADQLAASGRVVLAFDKRGAGASAGDGDRAGFDVLAADAQAAMAYLATRAEVDRRRIGLAGSSQAGWVAAKAIARGAAPADVLLLGAAGTALTVAEQNLYNTRVRLRCAGVGTADAQLALDQQRAFFAYLRDPAQAPILDALTARAAARPVLRDWLFPDSRSIDRSAGAWYIALDPFFDPLPVWQRYRGRAVFLFGALDDATPSALAARRLRRHPARVAVLQGAQHLGLAARDLCTADLPVLSRFVPELMPAVTAFSGASD